MPISKFVQPNFTDPTVDGSSYKTAIDNSIKLMSQVAAQFACSEQEPLAMAVDIRAGTIFSNNTIHQIDAQSVTFDVAPTGTLKRIDRVVINTTSGVASVIKGTESTTPSAPDITAGLLPVASVLIGPNQINITNYDITDERLSGVSYWGENTTGFSTFSGVLTLNQALGVDEINIGTEAKNVSRIDFFVGGIQQRWGTSFNVNPTDTSKIILLGGSSALENVAYFGRVHVASSFVDVNQPSPNSVGGIEIQDASIDLGTKVKNNLAVSHLDSGASASEATFWRGDGKWAGLYNRKFIVEHRMVGNAGVFMAGAWRTRILNRITYNDIPDASLLSNQFTLPAGTYDVRASACATYAGMHKIRLRNMTTNTTAVLGMNAVSNYRDTPTLGQDMANLDGRFTITEPTPFELQHRCLYSRPVDEGMGWQGEVWDEENIYAQVVIEKIL